MLRVLPNMFIASVSSMIIYKVRRVTNGCLSVVRIFVGPSYQRGIDSLYGALDRGYRSSLPRQLQDIENELASLRDAKRNTGYDLRKLEKHMNYLGKFLQKHVEESTSIGIILGDIIPGVNFALSALRPLFNVLKRRDGRVRALVNETVASIGSLVKEVGKLQRGAAQENINLNAAELEELTMFLKMIRDGLDVIKKVLEERQSVWLAFGRADRHQSDIKAWNETVRIMIDEEDKQHRHMIYYRTRLILQTSKLNLLVSVVNLAMAIFVIFYLQTVLEILLDIRQQLQPFYMRVWNGFQKHLKKF